MCERSHWSAQSLIDLEQPTDVINGRDCVGCLLGYGATVACMDGLSTYVAVTTLVLQKAWWYGKNWAGTWGGVDFLHQHRRRMASKNSAEDCFGLRVDWWSLVIQRIRPQRVWRSF